MKIKRIEYSNFRNFQKHGAVDFCTDGSVTIIYGVNGAGKTTFHQLFQWIIYGKVRFNKTASDKMYNLDFERKAKVNEQFSVWGSIEFEHGGEQYQMRREWTYQKTLMETKSLKRTFTMSKKDNDQNWVRLSNPEELVERLLPSGLADYFFFDGESMITDLKAKGKDSATSLKEAMYLMLDLSIYDKAVDYIGKVDNKTTALGTLFMSKVTASSNAELVTLGQKMDTAQSTRDRLKETDDKYAAKIEELREKIQEISEQIGSAKSQSDYERQRKECQERAKNYHALAVREYELFGEELISVFPKLMISKVIEKASQTLKHQAAESKLVPGVSKELIDALLTGNTCICGNPLGEAEKDKLRELYNYLPPLGYDSLYRNFTDMAARWGKEYNRQKLEEYIQNALNYLEKERKEYENITRIDKAMQEDKQYESLVVERIKDEEEIKELTAKRDGIKEELYKAKLLINKCKKEIEKLSDSLATNKEIDRKIAIMEAVKAHFETLITEKSGTYSKQLEVNIQELLDYMLEAKRTVSVSPDFSLRVVDNFDDESKSEGQFATVSFAYIGGIFKLLREEKILENKEYPLVLDAPFSKLGDQPRQKVIDTIPEYAPQIIILSKDNLQDCFAEDKVGRVYTIETNVEQNIATIEEGFLWK